MVKQIVRLAGCNLSFFNDKLQINSPSDCVSFKLSSADQVYSTTLKVSDYISVDGSKSFGEAFFAKVTAGIN